MTARNGVAAFVLADDLSGATEVAAAIAPPEAHSEIQLSLLTAVDSEAPVVALDLDSRRLAPAAAAEAVRAALRLPVARSAGLIFAKVDSLLRGNLAASVAAVRESDRPTVVATALPAQDRSVRDGVVRVGGEPLHRSGLWAAEGVAPPSSLESALAPLPVAVVPLSVVRGPDLPAALVAALGRGLVPLCDAATDADLDAIAAAALTIPGVRLVGAGGLAGALGRALRLPAVEAVVGEPPDAVLTVVGTAAPGVLDQIRRLEEAGATHIRLPITELLDGHCPVDAVRPGSTVLSLESPAGSIPGQAHRIALCLAARVADALRSSPQRVDLVLTGGETARRILDALGIVRLTPVRVIHHGAVACRADDGRTVVTRPGSFGDPDSLVLISETLIHPTKGFCHG